MSGFRITIETGCRLHFGLLSFGSPHGPNFGGIGVMLDEPRQTIQITGADRFSAIGQDASRIKLCAQRFIERHQLTRLPACCIEQIQALPAHAGLGSGTQTSLAVAAGLRRILEMPSGDAEELARDVGRARRSSIGTHGFLLGRLLFEQGHRGDEIIGPLTERVELPDEWRAVLFLSENEPSGVHGEDEANAFARVPPVSDERQCILQRIVSEEILPAARAGQFEPFAEAVHRYGYEAGLCFAEVQSGPFASPAIARRVAWLREHSIAGAGQSSWGPTVFAWTPSQSEADDLAAQTAGTEPFLGSRCIISRVRNRGASIEATEE